MSLATAASAPSRWPGAVSAAVAIWRVLKAAHAGRWSLAAAATACTAAVGDTEVRVYLLPPNSDDSPGCYAALLMVPGLVSVTLSLSAATETPWPLQGPQRAHPRELLRLNGRPLMLNEALAYLDLVWSDDRVRRRALDIGIVALELEQQPEAPEPGDLDEALVSFRRRRGLARADAMARWLATEGITREALRERVRNGARLRKLRRDRVGSQAERLFADDPRQFARAEVLWWALPSEQAARDALRRLSASGEGFEHAAAACYRQSPVAAGQLWPLSVRRHQLDDSDAERLFSAKPGAVLGLFASPGRTGLVKLQAIHQPQFDPGTRDYIESVLFETWLRDRRSQVRAEWLWGAPVSRDSVT